MQLSELTEAKTLSGYLGTVSNSFYVNDIKDAVMIGELLRKPKIGWHTQVKEIGEGGIVTLTINVDRDKLE